MPLVCPFWSDYVKSVEVCPSVDGGTAYFLEENWDGAAQYIFSLTHYAIPCGGPWASDANDSAPSAYSGTPIEVWASTNPIPGGPTGDYAILAKFFGSTAAAGINWTVNQISGPGALTYAGVDTSLDMALVQYSLPSIDVAGVYINVIDFTPDGGAPIRLHLKRVIELS